MTICSLGHIAHTRDLRAARWTRGRLASALRAGSVVRLHRGTYACAHLDAAHLLAASASGSLTCISALRQHGVWAGHDIRTHVQVARTSSVIAPTNVRLHREVPRFAGTAWQPSRMQVLWQAMRCLDAENAVAAMESAIERGFLSEAEVRRLGAIAPRRLQPVIRHLVTNSGSGNETIVRLRLCAAGFRVESQGYVPGLGHQDLVVDDCVGLEIDSHEWHEGEQRATDADRDLLSEGLGRRVVRIRPAHIHRSWPHTLAVIERVVRDAQALRR